MLKAVTVSDGAGNSNGSGGVNYTTKEMFTQILDQIRGITARVETIHDNHDKRLGSLEIVTSALPEMVRKTMQLSTDFTGFERRLELHIQEPYHIKGGAQLERIATEVDTLKTKNATTEAVEEVLRKLSDQRRTMQYFMISQAIVIVGLIVTLYRTFQH